MSSNSGAFAEPFKKVLPAWSLSAALIAFDAMADAEEARDAALYPAAQCAALWYGFDDYARLSAFLDRTESDIARAKAFRAVAYRLAGGETGRVDTFIAQQRRLMVSMIDAMIYGGDEASRDLFRRLTQTCESFAGQHPETEGLK